MYQILKNELSQHDYAVFFNEIFDNYISDEVADEIASYFYAYKEKNQNNIDGSIKYDLKLMFLHPESLFSYEASCIVQLIVNYLRFLPKNKLLIVKENEILFESEIYSEIWEDVNLPNYFILHDGVNQNYMLFDKLHGKLLPFFLHDICSCTENNTIIGRHHGQLYKFDFCKIQYTEKLFNNELPSLKVNDIINEVIINQDMDGIERIVSVNINEYEELIQKTIVPIKTNVPYLHTPLKHPNLFYQNLLNVSKNTFFDKNSSIENELPF